MQGVGEQFHKALLMVSSATLERFHRRLINQSRLHCGTALCTLGGLRVRGDGCLKVGGLSAKRGHNLESVGLSHFTRRCVGRNGGEGGARVNVGFPLKGVTGTRAPPLPSDVSAASTFLFPPPPPSKHPQGRDEAQPGLFNLCYPPTQTSRRERR